MTGHLDEYESQLEKLLEDANVNYAQRAEFRSDPPRAIALLEHALKKRSVEAPAAYALARFRRGDWPRRGRHAAGKPTAYELACRYLNGVGWDDSFSRADILEDVEAIYRKRATPFPDADRRRLVHLWETIAFRRYPPDEAPGEPAGGLESAA